MMADWIVILRDGFMVDSVRSADRSVGEMAEAISGRSVPFKSDELSAQKTDKEANHEVKEGSRVHPLNWNAQSAVRDRDDSIGLVAKHLSGRIVSDLTIQVDAGTVVGLTGNAGGGIREAGQLLSGGSRVSGSLSVGGKEIRSNSVRAAIGLGLCRVPGDRWRLGAIREMNLEENIVMPRYGRFWHRRAAEEREVHKLLELFEVVPNQPRRSFGSLSGGNQQKAIFAKWIGMRPSVLIAESPTIGVDVGTRANIYRFVRQLADEGSAVCIVSEDLVDIATVCDRIYVLIDGKIRHEVETRGQAWEELAKEIYELGGSGDRELRPV
jgi:ABC-type sugar transport system ATPase subunit